MGGLVNCYSPDDFFNMFLEREVAEEERTFCNFTWWYINQTEIRFRFFLKELAIDECVIQVPRKTETEIWSYITLVDNAIWESISFTGSPWSMFGNKIFITTGYERIMYILESNFRKNVLTEEEYKKSVRILKGYRLQQIL